jgi:quercetin dioxygenase-like cupin family protein
MLRTAARRAAAAVWLLAALSAPAFAQPSESHCKPVSQRTGEIGCWIMIEDPVGQLPVAPIFWHLDAYPTRAAAEAAREARGTVVELLGRVWLFTIADADWRPRSGERVARIGPLPVRTGTAYTAMYMEAISTPGITSAIHTHSGPEAWYTLAGGSCLETPQGTIRAQAGGPPLIVPGGPPMLLSTTGTTVRRAAVLILHDSTQPAITMEHEWKPKGLCSAGGGTPR